MALDPFLAEICMFPFNFPPKGWAWCNGQILPISQNTALFSLLGTVYGGDGKSTFALPDLQGRCPIHPGQGEGLSLRALGESSGVEGVVLLESEIPFHTHTMNATSIRTGDATSQATASAVGAYPATTATALYSGTASGTDMAPLHIDLQPHTNPQGGGLPHNNMQPYITVNFCIALQGVFPQRP